MRVNVYSQELTSDTEMVLKESRNSEGKHAVFEGIRWYLHSSEMLHHTPVDDDRSAITIWLPKSDNRRKELARTFLEMAHLITESIERKGDV